MMQPVRQIEPLQIAPARHIAKWPALVNQPVMHDEVKRAVERHARANPLQRPAPACPKRNKQNRHARKHHRVEIVDFKPAFARRMVGKMPAPSPAMHHIFVRQRRHDFHRRDRQQHNRYVIQHYHNFSWARLNGTSCCRET
ncbi:hypothetical protein CRSA0334_06370 [Cronobacter malonaticus ENBT0334]|nr:hypothetical protein CRSA0334_06370 [Cronobacter malonaticus ENBT0334]